MFHSIHIFISLCSRDSHHIMRWFFEWRRVDSFLSRFRSIGDFFDFFQHGIRNLLLGVLNCENKKNIDAWDEMRFKCFSGERINFWSVARTCQLWQVERNVMILFSDAVFSYKHVKRYRSLIFVSRNVRQVDLEITYLREAHKYTLVTQQERGERKREKIYRIFPNISSANNDSIFKVL